MGSLMAGWDSNFKDPKAVVYQRNKSMITEEIAAYWKSKGADNVNNESQENVDTGSVRRIKRSNTLPLVDRKERLVNSDGSKADGEKLSKISCWDFTIRFEANGGKKFPSASETAPRIAVEISDTAESLTSNWQFALFELDGSRYAAVCVESDKNTAGSRSNPLKLKAWKTLPLVEDVCVLEKNAVVNVSGLS